MFTYDLKDANGNVVLSIIGSEAMTSADLFVIRSKQKIVYNFFQFQWIWILE